MAVIRGRQPRSSSSSQDWVRVKIDGTGHETDVRPCAVREGMTVIEGYPPHRGARPRPTKHFVAKDGTPDTPAGAPARKAAANKNEGEGSA